MSCPHATARRDAGLSVWYDEFELRIGDSLRRKIDRGLAASHFGVMVLSQAFFGRGWPEYELDGLVTQGMSGEQVLLPVWHNVTKREVMGYSPSLADRLARSTETHTVEEIAAEIVDVIRNSRRRRADVSQVDHLHSEVERKPERGARRLDVAPRALSPGAKVIIAGGDGCRN